MIISFRSTILHLILEFTQIHFIHQSILTSQFLQTIIFPSRLSCVSLITLNDWEFQLLSVEWVKVLVNSNVDCTKIWDSISYLLYYSIFEYLLKRLCLILQTLISLKITYSHDTFCEFIEYKDVNTLDEFSF